MDEQYAVDVFNTFYVDGKYPIAIDDKTSLTLGAQYYPQSSVGDEQIGSFSTYGMGLQAALAHGPVGVQLYYTQTGKGFDTQNPFGDHASYLNLMQVAFNTAGEKAWGIGGNVDFADLGVPGLTAAAIYADGRDRIDAQTGAPMPDRNETNVRVDYAVGKGTILEGLVATFRYSWLHQDGSPQTATQLRAYASILEGLVRRSVLLAASGRLAADGNPVARPPQLRGPLLTKTRAPWVWDNQNETSGGSRAGCAASSPACGPVDGKCDAALRLRTRHKRRPVPDEIPNVHPKRRVPLSPPRRSPWPPWLLPPAAHASFLPPEMMDTAAMGLAWFVICRRPDRRDRAVLDGARAAGEDRPQAPPSAAGRHPHAVPAVAGVRRPAVADRLAVGVHEAGRLPGGLRHREARRLFPRDGREGAGGRAAGA